MNQQAHNKPDRRELRLFGLVMGVMIALAFGLLLPWLWTYPWPVWPWATGIIIIGWAVAHPPSLRWLHGPWMKFADGLQWLLTHVIMLFLFYVVILPIGLLRRALGIDSMQRRFDRAGETYRTLPGEHDENRMDKPY